MQEKWKTKELSLASFLALKMADNQPKYEWTGDQCQFVFDNTEDLEDLAMDFVGGQALVEPREYTTTQARVRTEMFRSKSAVASR